MTAFASKFDKPETEDSLASDRFSLYRTLVSNPRIVLKCMAKQLKVWEKKVPLYITNVATEGQEPTATIDPEHPNIIQVSLPNGATLAADGSIRIMIEGKKYSLYRVESINEVKVIEFYIEGNGSTLYLPSSCLNTRILIDFEKNISNENINHPYYLQLERPTIVSYDDDDSLNGKPNYFYLTWRQGDKYDENAHKDPTNMLGSIRNPWIEGMRYSVGDKVYIKDEALNKIRYFKCEKDINPAGPAVSFTYPKEVTQHETDSLAEKLLVSFDTSLFNSPTVGTPELPDGADLSSVFQINATGATIESAVYQRNEHKILISLSSGILDGDSIELKQESLWDANNNPLPQFKLTYVFGTTSWNITDIDGQPFPEVSEPTEPGNPEHTPEKVNPLTQDTSPDKAFWKEIYLYNPEPAWLDYKQVQETKWSWYKCNNQTTQYCQDWLPIEYWLNIDNTSCVGVIMGDPGMSATDYLSSPAYFGQLEQIEGALETDDKGNFACFSGSDQNPQSRNEKADISGEIPRLKRFGDYTATGTTDVMLTSSKSGRPFQGHKVGLFG